MFEGKNVYLVPIKDKDTDNIIKWRNQPFVRNMFLQKEILTKEIHENWMRTMVKTKKVEQFIIYLKENDKAIGTVFLKNIDNNIFNGDIGYIKSIEYIDSKLYISIDYMGNIVTYKSGEFDKFTLAYAISIHKSQGSEYDNVVVILAKSFRRMFYNKLIYTAITRAKSSLIIIGNIESLNLSVQTLYADNRVTYLKNV